MAVEDIKNVHFAQNLNSSTAGEKIVAVFISSWYATPQPIFWRDFITNYNNKHHNIRFSSFFIFTVIYWMTTWEHEHDQTKRILNTKSYCTTATTAHLLLFVDWVLLLYVFKIYIFLNIPKNSRFLMENDDDKEDKEAE